MKKTYTKARMALKPTLIEKSGLQSEVFELKKQQFGIKKISEIINDRHNMHLTYFHIDHFLKRNMEKMNYYLQDDEHARDQAKKFLEETIKEINHLKDEAWEYYNKLKDEDARSIQVPKMLDTLLKIIQAIGKIVQEIPASVKPTVQQKVNILNITQNVDKSVKYLEQKGFVMIPKKEYEELKKTFEPSDTSK